MCAPVCAGVRQGLHVCAPFACTPPSIHLASPPSCTPCTCTALQAAPSARSEEQAFVCVHAVPHITLTTRPPPRTLHPTRLRPLGGAGAGAGAQAGLPRHDSALLCAGRPRHGDPVQRCRHEAVRAPCLLCACGCAVRVQPCLLRPGAMMRTTKQHYF